MMRFDPDLTGQLKVVTAPEVEALTLSGWHLVFTYQDTCQVQLTDSEPDLRPPNSGYYNSGMVSVTRYKPIDITYFVMRFEENSAIARMTNDLESLGKAVVGERESRIKAEKNLADAEKRVTEAKRAIDDAGARAGNISSQLENARTSNRKLEADLAKVRTAIGELKFKEIVG